MLQSSANRNTDATSLALPNAQHNLSSDNKWTKNSQDLAEGHITTLNTMHCFFSFFTLSLNVCWHIGIADDERTEGSVDNIREVIVHHRYATHNYFIKWFGLHPERLINWRFITISKQNSTFMYTTYKPLNCALRSWSSIRNTSNNHNNFMMDVIIIVHT